jgi:hypothetical protein
MPGPNDLIKYWGDLAKKGQVPVKIIFKAAADDQEFAQRDPVAKITITVTDPATGKEISEAREAFQLSPKNPTREIELKILNVRKVFGKLWDKATGKTKPKPFVINIHVEPLQDWQEYYSPNDFANVEVTPGKGSDQHVWLRTRKEGAAAAAYARTSKKSVNDKRKNDLNL